MAPLRLLVTAEPGTGKTTLCDRVCKELGVLASLPSGAFQLEGFLCYERRDGSGRRTGFDLISLDGPALNGGTARAPLASVDGPDTGKMVGKYHVQLEAFEALALPILERAAGGCMARPRILVVDEIGKMELMSGKFVQAMRGLLSSPDPSLHLLATVALNGGGLINESKHLPGVEVLRIDAVSRDATCETVAQRFAAALGHARSSGTRSSWGASRVTTSPAPAPWASAPGVPELTFAAKPSPGQFTPVYPQDPCENLASLNAGDYRLYVGGAAINRAFAEELQRAGQQPKGRFELLHEALLATASHSPGTLHWLAPAALFPKGAASPPQTVACHYCGKQAECWDAPWSSWRGQSHCEACWAYYANWAFQDLSAMCGLVPAGSTGGAAGELLTALQPVGLVALSIFRPGKQPRGNKRNVAMAYAVGPNCGATQKKARREVDRLSPADFALVLESVGHAVALAATDYNRERAGRAAVAAVAGDTAGGLPRIDVLRVCLLSGGVYRHPGTSKEDVAAALLRGILSAFNGSEHSPHYDLAWDDDAFQNAYAKLRDAGVVPAALPRG